MNNSHVLGLVTFGTCAAFAALTWAVSGRVNLEGSGWSPKGVRGAAVVLLLLGVALGYGAYSLDGGVRATTLFETMAPGSSSSESRFVVEHAGVEHTLMVAPLSEGPEPSRATVAVRLRDDKGRALLDERLEFEPEPLLDGDSRSGWQSRSLRFTPASASQCTLVVTPISRGIGRVHVHLSDPLKRDGKRLPGY